ncbi:MAG TPA: hypothetical protein VLA14_17055, partial [Polyangia bacterium]|nr:hypothetical protein [Polyangia bacterium]
MHNSRRLLGVLAASSLIGGLVACSPAGGGGSGSTGEIGSVSVALTGAGGVTINTVGYAITGPSSFSKNGSIDVSDSATISSTIGGIPAGAGFSITLNATSVDSSETCSGSASFDIAARQTTSVTVTVRCHQAPHNGSVQVNGALNVCPQIDGVSAVPNEVFVGSSVALVGAAHDLDAGPSPLSYAWTTTSGAVTDAASSS